MPRQVIDLNCDMGEGFGHWTIADAPDADLMALISSANVATGFHAGDPSSMDRLALLAKDYRVGLGAHPGYRDLQGFGRRVIQATPEELVADILYQVGGMREFGRRHGVHLQHVKPHGALYMTAAEDEDLSRQLIAALRVTDPHLYLFCMDVSVTYRIAKEMGHPVVREFFADRDYDASGSIVFRRAVDQPSPDEIAEKCVRACLDGKVETVDGEDIDIAFDSICFHSDTPGALAIGGAIRKALQDAGIRIASVAEVLAAAA